MAPEYLLDNVISPAMDLYAIGLILCEMILGHSPYTGLALDDVHWQKRFDVPLTGNDRRGLGPAAPVVNRAVQTDPTFRYTDAQSMAEELEAILGASIAGRSTTAPPPPSTRQGRPVRAQDLASEHRVY
jgi:serine/threonine-protein kinase